MLAEIIGTMKRFPTILIGTDILFGPVVELMPPFMFCSCENLISKVSSVNESHSVDHNNLSTTNPFASVNPFPLLRFADPGLAGWAMW